MTGVKIHNHPKDCTQHLPDHLGEMASSEILHALNLCWYRVCSVAIDWNANTVTARVYVLNRKGDLMPGSDGRPLTTEITYPAWRTT